jgi:C4-dicarboxylate transporter DctM subunit
MSRSPGCFWRAFCPARWSASASCCSAIFSAPVGFRRPRSSFRNLVGAARAAALPALIPVILLGGIMTGWFTPTEAGVVAVAYILIVVIPALNPRHMRSVWRDFVQAGLIYSLPLITIASASAFGWLLAYLRGPIVVSAWIGDMAAGDPRAIMFLLVAVFTIVGDFIEPIPAIIIFMPVVNQLTDQASINGVHMGIVLIITLAFGLITPPYGLSLLMASKFVGVRFDAALRASLPIYVIFFATIAFAIFFPSAVLWLPKTLFPESVGCFKAPDGARYICP